MPIATIIWELLFFCGWILFQSRLSVYVLLKLYLRNMAILTWYANHFQQHLCSVVLRNYKQNACKHFFFDSVLSSMAWPHAIAAELLISDIFLLVQYDYMGELCFLLSIPPVYDFLRPDMPAVAASISLNVRRWRIKSTL